MPRAARLDLPGLLQHVIARGAERGRIFADDADREDFCARMGRLLEETGTVCLTWALLPNHFHLLLRSEGTPIAEFMRRLLTGYVVRFNLRHRRSGRLFQNRYKSIVCEEEEYLLELVRYVGLNPLRAGLAKNMEELAAYRWGGHSVLMGNAAMPGQAVEEGLTRFGGRLPEARSRYAQFVAAGVAAGRRGELVGGGLRRSLELLGKTGERESFDERVLGAGGFVESLRRAEELRGRLRPAIGLPDLIGRVAAHYGLDPARVLVRSTNQEVAKARGVVCFVAVTGLGAQAAQIGRYLGLSDSGASRAVARGREVATADPGLVPCLIGP